MTTLLLDLRYAGRMLLRSPGFTLVAVLTVALGIGANASIFGFVNALLLRPPAGVQDPQRLIAVYTSDFSGPAFRTSSYLDYVDFSTGNEALQSLAAYAPTPASLAVDGRTERAIAEVVSGNYFSVLGISPAPGRGFLVDEDRSRGAHPVAVISHALWQDRFGRDPSVLGRSVRVNGQPFTVVGVAPKGFTGLLRGLRVDFWVPTMMQERLTPGSDALDSRGNRSMFLIGRLAPGATLPEAQAAFDVLARRLHEEHPEAWTDLAGAGRRISVLPEDRSRIFPAVRGPVVGFLAMLMGIVGTVLLVACANLAGLLLSRAVARRKEIAIRLALGAPRQRIVRQLLTESLLLALLGGAAGLAFAAWMSGLLMAFRPPLPVPLAIDLHLDARVFAFTLLLSLATGVLFGLAPALRMSRPGLVPALKDEGSPRGTRGGVLRRALIVAQVGLSVVLLAGAGLLARSFLNAQRIDPGFDVEHVLTMSLEPRLSGYGEPRGRELYAEILARVQSLPGVREASLAQTVPLGLGGSRRSVAIEGYRAADGEDMEVHSNIVAPRYFETMRIPLRRGHAFTDGDRPGAPGVAIVNGAFARRYWPGEDALGKRIGVEGPEGPMLEVVGVAADGKYVTLGEEPRPYFYLPFLQRYESDMTLHVSAAGDPARLARLVREEVRSIDPNLPVFDVKTLRQHMGISLLPQRLAGSLLGAFGLVAVLLAGIGLYGIVAQTVAQRTRELGVRMALGASAREVLGLVLREGALTVSIGVIAGLAVSLIVTRALASLLYGVSATDGVTLAAVVLVLVGVTLLASYVPARRATRIDPGAALRHE